MSRFSLPDKRIVWLGLGRTRPGLMKLLWAGMRLVAGTWLWGTATRLAHFQEPVKYAGVVLALGSLALLAWAMWGLWQSARMLGLKRLLIVAVVVFSLVVIVNVLTIPDTRPLPDRVVAQVGRATQQSFHILRQAIQSVTSAPDEFLYAYTGQRAARPLPSGIPTPNPAATPIRFVLGSGKPSDTSPARLRVGGFAEVAGTDGQPLRARSNPGTSSDIVARIPEGGRVRILDGPISSNGFNWWKVSSAQGEGWCAAQWLVPSD